MTRTSTGVVRRAVVTGAAGFIGSHLCERLTADGWQVTGVDAFTDYYDRADKEDNLAALGSEPRFSLLEADLCEDGWLPVLGRGDTVFHLAAQPGVRGSFGPTFAGYARDNILATQRVFEGAREAGCRRVVWASSSSVYGDAPGYPTGEADPTQPRSPYGVTKRACEDLARVYAGDGLDLVGLRYFTVYGPRQRPDMAMRRLCEAVVRGTPFPVYGDGRQSRDFTFVGDACDATLRAALAEAPAPIYNVGGGAEVTLAEVIATVERLAGRLLRTLPRPVQGGDVRRTAADTTAARRDLGWQPRVGIVDGLAAELAWVERAHGGVGSGSRLDRHLADDLVTEQAS
jgi:nucleoside-diphosphate-sugar epimerase